VPDWVKAHTTPLLCTSFWTTALKSWLCESATEAELGDRETDTPETGARGSGAGALVLTVAAQPHSTVAKQSAPRTKRVCLW
jgi:hypothetical protein